MTVLDCHMLAWFLRRTTPTTPDDLSIRWDVGERTARRRFAVWYSAGMAKPAGYAGGVMSWRPVAL